MQIYHKLLQHYGNQHWWPGEGIEIAIGAILTQQVNWKNVERALNNLKSNNCINPKNILETPTNKLEEYLKPTIYYRLKARTLKNFAEFILKTPNPSRKDLLSVHGIGPETADSILLYLYKKPYFVVDAYTKRIFQRLGIKIGNNYDKIQSFFMEQLPKDVMLYNEYHALIVRHGKECCTKVNPRCLKCPILSLCLYGREHKN
ncbi:MAG: endonuclease III domain-containing protein [Candidatus Heimdallarchaeaceae archaeon]